MYFVLIRKTIQVHGRENTQEMTIRDTETNSPNGQRPNNNDYTAGNENNRQQRTQRTSIADNLENPEEMGKLFIAAVRRLLHQLKRVSEYIMVELGGNQVFEKIAQWCVRNPHLAIIILAGTITMLLPFLILVGFGLSTILMTFTGFLVLEGTLLSILSILLVGCLFALAIVLLFFAVFGVAAYFGFAHIYDLFGGTERYRTALISYLQKESTCRETHNNNSSNGNPVSTGERLLQAEQYAQSGIN